MSSNALVDATFDADEIAMPMPVDPKQKCGPCHLNGRIHIADNVKSEELDSVVAADAAAMPGISDTRCWCRSRLTGDVCVADLPEQGRIMCEYRRVSAQGKPVPFFPTPAFADIN